MIPTLAMTKGLIAGSADTMGSAGSSQRPVSFGEPAVPETPALTQGEKEILAERRDGAEQYMRAMCTVLWRAEEDITYGLRNGDLPRGVGEKDLIHIRAGRIYRGVLYSYAYSTLETFLSFAGEQADNEVYSVSGLEWPAVNGDSVSARIGNDCSGAVSTAWNRIGAALPICSCKLMSEKYGFLKVGEYENDPNENARTPLVAIANGEQVMYRAYAQLQKADAVVTRKRTWGHARMVVRTEVVYNDDVTISGDESYVITLEQSSKFVKSELKVYDEALGEDVYIICGVDRKYSFRELYEDGYLPVTCREFVDPLPIAEPELKDSITEHSRDTILAGTIFCSKTIDAVTVTIIDRDGKEARRASLNARRYTTRMFDMQDFASAAPESIRGSIDLSALTPGSYHCTTVCRLSTGREFAVRDFDFTIS